MKTVGSLFAGVGGICLGFKQAEYNVIWANEIDKHACQTYKLNHPEVELIQDDIKNIKELPTLDVLTAGFPCQSFSIAGKRSGFEDTRGNLFFEIIRLIKTNPPKTILLENVKGLLNHDKGNTFNIIKQTIEDLGYKVFYQILDSNDFDIPQHRERLYIICFKKDDFLIDNFVIGKGYPEDYLNDNRISDNLEVNVEDKYFYTISNCPFLGCLVDVFSEEVYNGRFPRSLVFQWRRSYIRTSYYKVPTLTANMGTGGHNVPIIKDTRGFRKLTPRECFNLQTFPKDFKLPNIADCHLYKQAGNSVTVSVIKYLAELIGEKI